MSRNDVGDGFEFDQQTLFDNHIGEEFADDHTAVPYDEPPLLLDLVSNRPQGNGERILVNRFREAVAKLVVHGIEDTDNALC